MLVGRRQPLWPKAFASRGSLIQGRLLGCGHRRFANAAQQLLAAITLRQHVDEEHRPVGHLQRLQTHRPACAQGMRVVCTGVFKRPFQRVPGITPRPPALVFCTVQAHAGHVVPDAFCMQLNGAAWIHLHGILSSSTCISSFFTIVFRAIESTSI